MDHKSVFVFVALLIGVLALPRAGYCAQGWKLSFTPRIGLKFASATQFSDDPNLQTTFELPASPEYGGTIVVSPPGWERTQLILTGLVANEFDQDFRGILLFDAGQAVVPISFKGGVSIDRWDVELLLRSQIGNSNAQWILGGQFVEVDIATRAVPEPTAIPGVMTNITDFDLDNKTYIIKGGISGFVPFTEDARHRLIAHFLPAVGYFTEDMTLINQDIRQKDSNVALGGDIVVGYNYLLSDKLSFTFRYRAQFAFQDSGIRDREIFIFHGPELAFSLRL